MFCKGIRYYFFYPETSDFPNLSAMFKNTYSNRTMHSIFTDRKLRKTY